MSALRDFISVRLAMISGSLSLNGTVIIVDNRQSSAPNYPPLHTFRSFRGLDRGQTLKSSVD